MASTVQIVPKFSFPYVETYVNDYSIVDTSTNSIEMQDPEVHFIFPFISSKGPDNRFVKINTKSEMVSIFGKSNFKKYGQPYMQALNVKESPFSRIWCMRVMPDDAVAASRMVKVSYKADDVSNYGTYDNTTVTLLNKGTIGINGTVTTLPTSGVENGHAYKAISAINVDASHTAEIGDIIYATVTTSTDEDTGEETKVVTWNILRKTSTVSEDIVELCNKKFRIYYTTHDDSTTFARTTFDNDVTTTDANKDGFKTVYPGIMYVKSSGRGKYGNLYSITLSPNVSYNNSYGMPFYNFDVRSSEKGIQTIATYVGSAITGKKYETATLIDDVLEDSSSVIPVNISVNETVVDYVYDKYIEWIEEYKEVLEDKYEEIKNDTTIIDGDKLLLSERIDQIGENMIEEDQFDIFFGNNVVERDSTQILDDEYSTPLIQILTELTDDALDDENYYEDDYVDTSVVTDYVNLNGVYGVELHGGDDGSFDINNAPESLSTEEKEEYINNCVTDAYKKAFDGTYDKRILLSKRIKCDALFDANYPFEVKKVLFKLMEVRNDAILYLDSGITHNFTTASLKTIIKNYSLFDDYRVSKNIQYYTIKEPSTKKRVEVTISYFLAKQFVEHCIVNGAYIPFVKRNAQLTGHIRDSLFPVIEEYDTTLKQALVENRFNFFETVDDNIYQRATQNTSQSQLSDLLEESNVHTLFEMKRIVEADITDRLYDFTDPTIRSDFRDYEKAKFADWENRKVQSFDIEFKMNEWEAERSILHAYIVVVFRGLQKQAILEIDINKRDPSTIADVETTTDVTTIINNE